MTRNDLLNKISKKTKLSKGICNSVIDAFADEVKNCLMNGEKVTIKDFVSFEIRELQERNARNPKTGEIEPFPPTKVIKCRAGKAIKDSVSEKREKQDGN